MGSLHWFRLSTLSCQILFSWSACKITDCDKFPFRTKDWWEQQHVSWTHNRTNHPRQARQYGGCSLFSIDKAANRAVDKGYDKTNLGRWVWTRYKGRGNHSLRVITAYRPDPPQGPFTVYAQQNAYFHSIGRDICPRQALLIDLLEEIQQIMEEGDHIIVLMDGNSNMKQSDLSKALTHLSLQKAIIGRHGSEGPATHKRNAMSSPIDGIWISPGLEISKGGYFHYDQVIPSDHRCLWVDLSFMTAFGHNMPPLNKRQPRRLHCRDPRLVQNYVLWLFHQYAGPINLFLPVKNHSDTLLWHLCTPSWYSFKGPLLCFSSNSDMTDFLSLLRGSNIVKN